ncbi:MAG: aminoglycoside phosphotransferase family protein [Cyclobacteriaceae bacterium]|nr:aminoglycoside phosphotransferase family protein [Cyclobacteriaceae bacterium]
MVPNSILQSFNIPNSTVQPFGSGHINRTFKIGSTDGGYILQRINHHVFKQPENIAANIRYAAAYLKEKHPQYLFLSPVKATNGQDMVYDEGGYPWRLFPYISNTVTINEVQTAKEALEAAKGFARLTKNLSGCDAQKFHNIIERFHDLGWRYEQFETALKNTTPERLSKAHEAIEQSKHFAFLVNEYRQLINSGDLTLRITHNDTKINNILFDAHSRKTVCVIDLDTLMPGYFIYDLGDMVRTIVCPVSEEETDFSKISFRKEMYDAVVAGYLAEMEEELSDHEKAAIPFSGLMMTYIMALRFLADYLNGDVYYTIKYEGQNMNRAKNQLRLLQILSEEIR